MLKIATDVVIGDWIRGFDGWGEIVFIRWFDDFQNRGYFVVEYPDKSAKVVTMYQGENVFVEKRK